MDLLNGISDMIKRAKDDVSQWQKDTDFKPESIVQMKQRIGTTNHPQPLSNEAKLDRYKRNYTDRANRDYNVAKYYLPNKFGITEFSSLDKVKSQINDLQDKWNKETDKSDDLWNRNYKEKFKYLDSVYNKHLNDVERKGKL